MILLRARGSAELSEVASGSATQGLWLRNGKVGSQVSGTDRSRFTGRRTVGKLEEEEGEPAIERRRECTDLGETEEQVVCHASALALAIFITSVSGSESLASFTNRFYYLSRPPGFRRAFDAAETNGRCGRIQCQRGEISNSKGKR